MQFTVKIGKEEMLVKVVLNTLFAVYYEGKEYMILAENHGHKIKWILKSGSLSAATVAKIGKAIEAHLK